MKRRNGLTLTELAVAVVIVGVAASVAVPAAMNRRILANEASTVAALRDIAVAQERFHAARACDTDLDGVAEYGLIRELSGAVGVRTTGTASTVGNVLHSPLLPPEFRRFNRNSEVRRAGYLFRMFLPGWGYPPDTGGFGVPEIATGSLEAAVSGDLAETTWCCYAWPERRGVTGGRTFFVNQTADIVATDAGYSGTAAFGGDLRNQVHWRRGPKRNAGAAFAAPGHPSGITGAVAVGTVGRDGNLWQAVTPAAVEQTLVARGRLKEDLDIGRGSFAITSHQMPGGTRETIVVRATHLRPGRLYKIYAHRRDAMTAEFCVSVRADADGRAGYRFDGWCDAYPAGVASVTELVGGYAGFVEVSSDDEWFGAYETIPKFESVGHAAPSPESIAADEASAIAALREIAAAQSTFQAMKAVDVDVDGVGEFGLLRELTGLMGVRTEATASVTGNRLDPPLLPFSFAAYLNSPYGFEVARSGYLIHLFLPGAGGWGVSDYSSGALAAAIDSDLAATTWCCYASPQRHGRTGARTFFINQTGDVVATDATYSRTGAFTASNAGAAFQAGWALTHITGIVATGTVARDGNVWRAVPSRPDDHDFVVRGALTPTTAGAATGTFVVGSRQLANATDESIDVDASGLDASTEYRVVLTDASQAARVFGTATSDARGGVAFRFDGRFRSLPDGVASVTAFGGGAIELRDGDTPVLAGPIPVFATIGGPPIADSSAVFHVKRPLDELPRSLPRSGSLDVRVTNAPDGVREELVVEITTYDRGATYDVVALDAQDVATPLGAIRAAGLRGTGALTLDTKRGDAVPGAIVALSGARIEVRASTGAVVLAGTMPVVK